MCEKYKKFSEKLTEIRNKSWRKLIKNRYKS